MDKPLRASKSYAGDPSHRRTGEMEHMEAESDSSDLVGSDGSGDGPSRAEPVARAEAVDFCG